MQVKEEIGSYGLSKMDKRQFVDKATILERNTYLPGSRKTTVVSLHHQPPHTPVKEQGEKQYKCKVSALEDHRTCNVLVVYN